MEGMKREAPVVAKWLLRHFGSSPNNTAIIGDLDEKRRAGCSRAWYWRQVAVAIIVSMVKDTWTHKLLALRALIVGWFVFWFLYGGLINYALQVFATVTESLYRLRVIPLEGQLYCFQALHVRDLDRRNCKWMDRGATASPEGFPGLAPRCYRTGGLDRSWSDQETRERGRLRPIFLDEYCNPDGRHCTGRVALRLSP
jgi:hypothetical protein